MVKCTVLNCKSDSVLCSKQKNNITFHRFPKESSFKLAWVKATGRKNWVPSKYQRLCSQHFNDADFYFTNNGSQRRLHLDVVPTLNLPGTGTSQENKSNLDSKKKLDKVPASFSQQHCSSTSLITNQLPDSNSLILELSNKIKTLTAVCHQRKKTINRLAQSKFRKKKKINNLNNVTDCLKKMLQEGEMTVIANLAGNVKTAELFQRQLQKRKGAPIKKSYSSELRSFALTLHFYSPRAYEYVRQSFDTCLPHQSTIRSWHQSIDGSPGFTTESFKALKMKAAGTPYKILCNFVLDEMAIKRKIEWDGKSFHGYVDLGTGLDGDDLSAAKEALVFLVTAINGSWKLPLAYFLVDGITALQRCELVKQCLEKIAETGIKIVSLTCDGCPANVRMLSHLGCKINNEKLKTTFKNPFDDMEIAVFLDACHMLKLIRNCFESKKVFIDENGRHIEWRYLRALHSIQEKENFHLANKLRSQHIFFYNNKMKVKLASQLFSKSVSDALVFCENNLKLKDFLNVEGTAEFILIINNIFDILNSRNLKQIGYKKPLFEKNKDFIFNYLDFAKNYLIGLKTLEGVPLIKTPRKLGFLGFLVCIESTKYLYQNLIENNNVLKYLPLYKCSQDHLELFFCNMRQHGGQNNNPTARQFKCIYRKMLNYLELRPSFSGNCIPLDQISVLKCSSPIEKINNSCERGDFEDEEEFEIHNNEFSISIDLSTMVHSDMSEQIITYIAGNVVMNLTKQIKCEPCTDSLISKIKLFSHNLIICKDKGGLIYPSEDVVKICKLTEHVIKQKCIMNGDIKTFKPSCKISIISSVLKSLLGDNNLFESLTIHQFDQFPQNNNHIVELIRAISSKYLDIRMHYLTKQFTFTESKRQLYNKLILFKGM